MARTRRKVKSVSARQYTAMLRKMARHKSRGQVRAWLELGKRAVRMRRKMIAANPHTPVRMPKYAPNLEGKMPPAFKAAYKAATRTAEGRKVAKLFREFWKIPYPPEIKTIPGGPEGKTIFLMGMGTAPEVHLSALNKGEKKKASNPGSRARTVVKGKWLIASDSSGRHVLILNQNRPIKKPFKFVGYAPETNYIPTPDIEAAGTHKKGKWWRHLHGENDSKKQFPEHKLKWPAVFADRNGKVDRDSNFIYGKTPSAKISNWMYG